MKRITLIPVAGETKELTSTTLEAMQKAVEGYVERVPLKGRRVLLVNEEGLIHGMELNPRASALAGKPLVGPAVLLEGPCGW